MPKSLGSIVSNVKRERRKERERDRKKGGEVGEKTKTKNEKKDRRYYIRKLKCNICLVGDQK